MPTINKIHREQIAELHDGLKALHDDFASEKTLRAIRFGPHTALIQRLMVVAAELSKEVNQ